MFPHPLVRCTSNCSGLLEIPFVYQVRHSPGFLGFLACKKCVTGAQAPGREKKLFPRIEF